ncbi:MAG: ion transporter [Alphaproteobacteria bacterium]|nr:ion transporter [Alphaproteobacteria bacterium]
MNITDLEKERAKAQSLVQSKNFSSLIMFLIFWDAILLGFMTSAKVMMSLGWELFFLDRLIVALFICEMMIKIYAYGGEFFKKGWNLLDLFVVTLSIIPATSFFVILRSFRLLRLLKYVDKDLRVANFIQNLMSIVPIFLTSLVIYFVVLYVFSVMSVGLFGDIFIAFGDLNHAVFSLVQVMSFDSLSVEIIQSVMIIYPKAWIFFFSFILFSYLIITTFVVSAIKEVIKKA